MLVYLMMIESPEDSSTFEKIYYEYRALMFHIANKILNNEQDAEDAVHSAFVKVAENIHKIDEAVCQKTLNYIVTIVESNAIDLYRVKQRRKKVVYSDETIGLTISAPEIHGLDDCILRLPPRYRQVIILKYAHGFSCREIAEQLGISEVNAIQLDQRAKKRLCQLCKEADIL